MHLLTYMGKGGMVGGGTTPLKTKILANHPPYDVGPRAQGGGKFLAAEGGRKFFHPPWGAIFSEITTPVKRYWPTFISKVPPWPKKFFLTPLPWAHPHGSKLLAAEGGWKFFTHSHPLGHHPPYILDLAHVWWRLIFPPCTQKYKGCVILLLNSGLKAWVSNQILTNIQSAFTVFNFLNDKGIVVRK